jgi:hypothetical protein
MTDMQTCAACDYTGFDVKRALVELPPPWRMTTNPITGEAVPEKWAHEPRCTDRDACAERMEVIA